MLGTPNFGSFAPVQALSGGHSLVRSVAAALDVTNSQEDLVNKVWSTFPGLYQMLPAPPKFSAWTSAVGRLASVAWGLDPLCWPMFSKCTRRWSLGNDRFTLVAGINQETVVSVRREGDEFVYTTSVDGDGTVPLAFAQLDGVTTYLVEEQHGSLANNVDVARAVIDLVETVSRNNAFPTTWTPGRRGALREVRAADIAPAPYGGRRGGRSAPG